MAQPIVTSSISLTIRSSCSTWASANLRRLSIFFVVLVVLLLEAVFHAGLHGLDRHLAILLGDVLHGDAGTEVVVG